MLKNLYNILAQYKAKWFDLEFVSEIKSWKEAEVFKVKHLWDFYALKVYKDPKERSFKKNDEYLEGKYYKSKSERRAVAAWNSFSKKMIHSNWVKREFYMLQKIYWLWWVIPKPLDFTPESILMELIWNEGDIGQKLKDAILTEDEARKSLSLVLENIKIFYKLWIVHADLSAFNILYFNRKIYIIDFPQAVDIRTNPNSKDFLIRDLNNVCDYFRKYFEIDTDKIIEEFNINN